MKTSVEIQNLKCGGCGTINTYKLNALKDVNNDLVAIKNSAVYFEYTTEAFFEQSNNTLARLGYPLAYDKNTFGRKTKSYISCARDKMGS